MTKPSKQEASTPTEKAASNLQYALDRATSYISEHPRTSFAAYAGQAARSGIPMESVIGPLQAALEQAQGNAVALIEAAYEAVKNETPRTRQKPNVPSLAQITV